MASEILAVKKLPMRSRIVARLVNAAKKCYAMGNFHSCRSILAGLQAPPIFRLRKTWNYLRTHHANRYYLDIIPLVVTRSLVIRAKRGRIFEINNRSFDDTFRYETMERLCKIYKHPCTQMYRQAWAKVETCNSSFIPYVGHLLLRLLDLGNNSNDCHDTVVHVHDGIKNANDLCKRMSIGKISVSDTRLKINQNNLEQKQESRKNIFASILTRMKNKKDEKTIYEEKADGTWTIKEQDLAWKYFFRWYNAVLKRKFRHKEEERLRDMDPRMKRVLDVVTWMVDCQKRAQGYNFPGHSFTKEFLLKTRYREDRDNFFISLKLEPSMIT